MKRKTASAIMIGVLLISMVLMSNVPTVRAQGTIYIRADGSIDPPTANITTTDNVTYYFTDNNYDEIRVQRSNIVVDGNGYTLHGTAGIGIWIGYGVTAYNVTIQNTQIEDFMCDIYLGSSGNTIFGNNVTNNYWGIRVDFSNNTLSRNNVTNNEKWGIYFESSYGNNTLRGNVIAGSEYNFGVYGFSLSGFVNDVDVSNTVDGKPIYYWVNVHDATLPLEAGYVALVNCTSITMQDLDLAHDNEILLAYTTNSTMTRNDVTDTYFGIWLFSSSNNTLSGNNITNNALEGVWLLYSSNNTFSGNNITNTPGDGIFLLSASSNNSISDNNLANNYFGIELAFSSGNMIYHNNFIDNTYLQACSDGSPNVWDDGYSSGGNYWSEYHGADSFRGPYQNETGSDGIGDTPYIIDANNIDNYPLVQPYPAYDIVVSTLTAALTMVCQGYGCLIDLTVANKGDFTVFNVTIYANMTDTCNVSAIGTLENVNLNGHDLTMLAFMWDTIGFALGNYTMSAFAWPVSGETSIIDNALIDGELQIIQASGGGGSRTPYMD
jgi:parallel beta-helix repeat protein